MKTGVDVVVVLGKKTRRQFQDGLDATAECACRGIEAEILGQHDARAIRIELRHYIRHIREAGL